MHHDLNTSLAGFLICHLKSKSYICYLYNPKWLYRQNLKMYDQVHSLNMFTDKCKRMIYIRKIRPWLEPHYIVLSISVPPPPACASVSSASAALRDWSSKSRRPWPGSPGGGRGRGRARRAAGAQPAPSPGVALPPARGFCQPPETRCPDPQRPGCGRAPHRSEGVFRAFWPLQSKFD